MSQSLLCAGCEVTIRDVQRVVAENDEDNPEALACARGACVTAGGPRADARCDSQSYNWSTTAEPSRGTRHFPGTLSHLPFGSVRLADRPGYQLQRTQAVLRVARAQGLSGHGVVLGALDVFRK